METSVSLLNRAKVSRNSDAWKRIVEIYEPLIGNWLRKRSVAERDVLDITQDVLYALSTSLNDFEHNGRRGAFRNWLRFITVNRARRHWQKNKNQSTDSSLTEELLEQLEDPNSDLTRQWDEEHDRYVLARIIQLITPDFDPKVMEAFQRVTIHGQSPAQVAQQLDISKGQVYKYKYRVMQRMISEAKEIIDAEVTSPSGKE
ncbi:MAG: sigma-70 family RNA polymerase sigma factor [Planctomycetota bacterium]